MSLKSFNHKAFTTAETFLIILIVAILGGTGYYVYHANKNANNTLNSAAKDSSGNPKFSPNKKAGTDETTDWKQVTSQNKAFTVRIPDGWKVTNDTGMDRVMAFTASDTVYAKGTRASVKTEAIPGSDSLITLDIFTSDQSYQGWTTAGKATKAAFGPVDGVSGVKYSQVLQKGDPLGIEDAKGGEHVYEYEFKKDTTYYHVAYFVDVNETDNISLVDKTVGTLKFE